MSGSTSDVESDSVDGFILFDLRGFEPWARKNKLGENHDDDVSRRTSASVSYLFENETQTKPSSLENRGAEKGLTMSQEIAHGTLDQEAVAYDVKIEGGKLLVTASVDLAAEAGKLGSALKNPIFQALLALAVQGLKQI